MTTEQQAPPRFAGRTAWARNLQTPLRAFLRAETGGAAVLLAAAVAALAWANIDASSYGWVWHTILSIRVGDVVEVQAPSGSWKARVKTIRRA